MQPIAQLPTFSLIQHALLAKPGQAAPRTESGPHHAHFVYLSSQGWNWQPYGDDEIGIMAQRISTSLRLRYHDLDANANLTGEIDKAETNNEPVMLIADASSMPQRPYSDALAADTCRCFAAHSLSKCDVRVRMPFTVWRATQYSNFGWHCAIPERSSLAKSEN